MNTFAEFLTYYLTISHSIILIFWRKCVFLHCDNAVMT